MDVLWFLQRRLQFVSDLYDNATTPFSEKIRAIEAGEPPYEDTRDPEYQDVSEPPFLDEYLEADEAVEVIGHWCLCMAQGSLKAYLAEYVHQMAVNYRWTTPDLASLLAAKKGKSWFERYRLFFLEDLGVDWQKGPVALGDLEHLNLTRDDLIHNVDVMTQHVHQTGAHAERFPKGLFTDDTWAGWGLGGKITVRREQVSSALGLVNAFCTWLEGIRIHYVTHVRSVAEGSPGK